MLFLGRRKRIRSGWQRAVIATALGCVLLLNAIAFMQTWTMTHYSTSGTRTVPPEKLTLWDKVGAVFTGVTVPRPANSRTPSDLGLPFDTIIIPVAGSPHETLEAWYIRQDSASTKESTTSIVLMFPGYATAKDALLEQASLFYEMGWSPFLVDFRGAGGSTDNDTTLGIREARDVAIALDYARQTYRGAKFVLYSVSMGASAILTACAHDAVRADALILESPFDSLLNTVRNRFSAAGLPAFPSAELMIFWGSVQHGFNGFAHNPADYAAGVQCPTLLMYGESDPRVTPEQSMALYERLNPEGGKQRVAFPGAGHESLVANDKALWVESVDRFLSGLTPAR